MTNAAPTYVDVFVTPVPKQNLAAYRKLTALAREVWLSHGALDYVAVQAEDVAPGKHTSFPQAVKLQPDEVVIVAWVTFASRAARDRANGAAMADPRLEVMKPGSMPFDARRMFWGGFSPLPEAPLNVKA